MKRRGMTLIELLIAVSLVSLLSVGMLFSIRVGLGALEGSSAAYRDAPGCWGARILVAVEAFLPFRANCISPGGMRAAAGVFTGEAKC